MNPTLRRLFENALRVSLVSPIFMSCGPGGVDTKPFELPVCEGGLPAVSGLMPANAVDYVDMRRLSMFSAPDGGTIDQIVSKSGTACSGANDMSACTAAFSALASSPGFGSSCFQVCQAWALGSTRGDLVSSVATIEGLKAFLGTIDTPSEAVLIALAQPINIDCSDKSRGGVRKVEHGYEVIGTTGFACGEGSAVTQHVLAVNSNGDVAEVSSSVLERGMPGCAIGRRPCGLQVAFAVVPKSALARHFVSAAHLEAASVPAFLRMRDELSLHGAPLHLRVGAVLSARDEVRHARAVAGLARRFGGTPVRPRITAMPLRPLAEVARDNAVEGCVRETFGALVAHRQALHAKDAHVKSELQSIAHDETRHAALSWQVHEWAMAKLSRDQRAEVRSAQREAVHTLRAEAAEAVDADVVEQAGMPQADEAVTLVDALKPLWA